MTLRGFPGRWAVYGLGIALSLGTAAPVAAADKPARPPGVTTIHHKSRSFKIPFNVDPAERSRLKEVQLWVSEDSGDSWKAVSRTTPDHPAFTFRAARDEEYWFAVRTLDTKGRLYPGEDEAVEPSMKVIIDTKPPTLVIEPDGRRGSTAAVRWEAQDDHLDLSTLVLEYQVEGAREWRQVPIRRPALIGKESWDAGTAEPLKVRATIADKAGNSTEAAETLSAGTPRPRRGLERPGRILGPSAHDPRLPHLIQLELPPGRGFAPGRRRPRPSRCAGPHPGGPGVEPRRLQRTGLPASGPADGGPRRYLRGEGGPDPTRPEPPVALQYAVDDAGPNGPAIVELWATQDGGQSWTRRGEDADRTSPFEVDLGGQGTFGLSLVARSASGLGDQPPSPGDPPRMWVEIDGIPPTSSSIPPRSAPGRTPASSPSSRATPTCPSPPRPSPCGGGPTSPAHAGGRSSTASRTRASTSGPSRPRHPSKFHIRINVLDTLGNRGSAETTETGPVIVNRARPRSRIIGLDPSTRTGTGPAARPLR